MNILTSSSCATGGSCPPCLRRQKFSTNDLPRYERRRVGKAKRAHSQHHWWARRERAVVPGETVPRAFAHPTASPVRHCDQPVETSLGFAGIDRMLGELHAVAERLRPGGHHQGGGRIE